MARNFRKYLLVFYLKFTFIASMLIHFQKFGRNFNFKFPIIMDYSMRFIPAIKIIGNLDHNFRFLKFFKEILEFWNFKTLIGNYYSVQKFEIYWKKDFFIFLGLDFFYQNFGAFWQHFQLLES